MRPRTLPELGVTLALAAGLCRPVAAGGGGDVPRWWCDKDGDGLENCYVHEYSFVETCILITLVCMALVFEAVHHRLTHMAGHSYHYGKMQAQREFGGRPSDCSPRSASAAGHAGVHVHRRLSSQYSIPLWKHWFSRLCSEMMVLGYIAFCIFISREAGLFAALSAAFPPGTSGLHMPLDSMDWLHMVEVVHMKLFIGMLIYFLLVSRIVSGSVAIIRAWEEMRILRMTGTLIEQTFDTSSIPGFDSTAVIKYCRWRSYFIVHVLDWKQKRGRLYKDTLRGVGLDAMLSAPRREVLAALENNFAFSAYLSYAVCGCTTDTVEIHWFTWIAVLFVLSLFAMLHRFAHVVLLDVVPVFIVAAFAVLGVFWLLVRTFKKRVESSGEFAMDQSIGTDAVVQCASGTADGGNRAGEEAAVADVDKAARLARSQKEAFSDASLGAPQDARVESIHEKYNTELIVLRTLQVILFVCSYACGRTLGDPADWKCCPDRVAVICCVFGGVFCLLGAMLPGLVPTFAALMAMPPYVDRANAELFLTVLADHKQFMDDIKAGNPERRSVRARTCAVGRSLSSAQHRVPHSISADAMVVTKSTLTSHMVPHGISADAMVVRKSSLTSTGDGATDPSDRENEALLAADWQRQMASQVDEIHRSMFAGGPRAGAAPTGSTAQAEAPHPGGAVAAADEPSSASMKSRTDEELLERMAALRQELEGIEAELADRRVDEGSLPARDASLQLVDEGPRTPPMGVAGDTGGDVERGLGQPVEAPSDELA